MSATSLRSPAAGPEADATLAAAQSDGGAGSMVGAGVGLALGQQMTGALAQSVAQPHGAPGGPPPPPSAALFHLDGGARQPVGLQRRAVAGALASGQFMLAGKPFQVFVNGVTAEVHGERPYSKVKMALAVLLALALVGLGLALYAASR